jgi:hypothetical protein
MKNIILSTLILAVIITYVTTASAQNYYYNGHQYTVVAAGSISWNDAQAAASASGGYLVTITDVSEQSFIDTILNDYPSWDQLLIGGYQTASSSDPSANWAWVTGEAWNYTNWTPSEPNDNYGYASEEYLGIRAYPSDHPNHGMWNDTPGISGPDNYGYIVESVVPEPISSTLFIVGGATLGFRRFRKRFKK